jgi:drug/metabolite transporter (DMT)-like permease
MSAIAANSPVRGILTMVVSLFFFMSSDTVSKWLTQDYPVGEIIFVRSFFIYVPIMVVLYFRRESLALRASNWRMHLLRSGLFVASTFIIIYSVKLLPLADVIAFLHSAPLIIAALSVPLLGERVGWHRWTAILVGFGGVLIMVRPTPEAFQIAALVPLAGAVATSLRDIATRRMSATESSSAILTWSTAGLILAAGATLPFEWKTPDVAGLSLMALSGVLNGIAHFLMIEAYRLAQAAIVAPFKYSSIPWGVLFGYLVWGDLPDMWIVTGGAVVVGAGLYLLHRETRNREARA